jgi:hypothetical protein
MPLLTRGARRGWRAKGKKKGRNPVHRGVPAFPTTRTTLKPLGAMYGHAGEAERPDFSRPAERRYGAVLSRNGESKVMHAAE